MAAWHFRFSIVPRAAILSVHGQGAVVLDEFRTNFEAGPGVRDPDESLHENYWRNSDPRRLIPEISKLLPERVSWSADAAMFGDEEGDSVEVWEDSVDCAVDIRHFSIYRLEAMVSMAARADCLIVLHESGRVIPSESGLIVAEIETSRAYSFCVDPKGFMLGRSFRGPSAGE